MTFGDSWPKWLRQNPVLAREVIRGIRTGRPLALFLPVAPLVGMATLSAIAVRTAAGSPAGAGEWAYQIYFSLAYFAMTLILPALAAFDFASERQENTWDALASTPLGARAIARAKFSMNATFALLLLAMVAPLAFICPFLEGPTVGEVVAALIMLGVIAVLSTAFGCAVGSTSRGSVWAVLTALAFWILGAPLLYFGGGIGFSFLAHGTWPRVPANTAVWLPLAYARAPLDGHYALLLLAVPFAIAGLGFWFSYQVALAGLRDESDDRTTGLKVWYLVALPFVAAMTAIPGFMTHGAARLGAWLIGLGGLFVFLVLSTFVLAGDSWEPSPRVEYRWEQCRAPWLTRVLGPGLVQTMMLVLVSGLMATAMFSLVGAAAMASSSASAVPAPPAVALLLCGETWGAFFAFLVGFLLWARARSKSAGTARAVSLLVALLAAGAPFVVLAVARWGGESRAHDVLLLASASPLYALVVVNAILDGEPHLAVVTSIAGSLGWVLLGVTLFGFGAKQATRIVAVRRSVRARLDSNLQPDAPALPLR